MKFSKPIAIGFLTGALVASGGAIAIAATASGPATVGPQYSQGTFIGLCVNPVTRASYWEVNTNFGTEASPNASAQSNCANGYYQAVLPVDPDLIPIVHQTAPTCVLESPVTATPSPSVTVTTTPIACK